jgi:HD-like signal output (HDOD) protein/CheY-like chemotaxis protein
MIRKNLLIVDDEPKVLMAMRQLLQSIGEQWFVDCASTASEALQILSTRPFDAIVSDLVMPGMDGIQLLSEVMHRYPHTCRIVLCWQADRPLLPRVFGIAHQYLYKPCDPKVLRDTLNSIQSRTNSLSNNLERLISQMRTVPSLPTLYAELMKEMRSEDASLDKAGEIIARDPGMSAKILQLVNSAFFGLRRHVASPEEATLYLGIETVKTIVLSLQVFSQFDRERVRACQLDQLWNHSWTAGVLSRHICGAEDADTKLADQAFLGGMLHDIGKLVLAVNLPDQYRAAVDLAKRTNIPINEAEKSMFGASHADVGGFLLGLWGLPDSVVNAVVFHHTPSHSTGEAFTPLAAVHVADVLDHDRKSTNAPYPQNQLDLDYLARLGVMDRYAVWQAVCWDALDQQSAPKKEYALES